MSAPDPEFAAALLSLHAAALKAATRITGDPDGCIAIPMAADSARALGAALEAIAGGADPYDALGIARRGRGNPKRAALWLVVPYLRHRANGMTKREAHAELEREHGAAVPTLAALDKWYSERTADERDALWDVVEGRTYRRDEHGAPVIERSGPDAAELRAEMEAGAHRGT